MTKRARRKRHPAVEKAIAYVGSQQALAKLLDCPQSAISKRLCGQVPITAEWAIELESVLGGHVKRQELRPDLWN